MASTITRVTAWWDTCENIVLFTRFGDVAFYAVLVESTSRPVHFFSIQTSATV